MDDQNNPSPASSSSTGKDCRRLRRRHSVDEDVGDPVACTGKSCQSCTAGVIADCVAVCCCPCAVVSILALAFVKLPWAVARRCLGRRRKKRMLAERRKRGGGDRDGISEKGRVEEGMSEIVLSCRGRGEEEVNDDFSAEFKAEEVWLELYEVGHLGFGRVSFTGIPFQDKGT
ncbi:hypothetical protein Salat_1383300 [Sesamum alatum]|uniref:Uncharacterized protein n=1 Tax=Sesamum alatum TaxID=300844 RepID=A0AAE1YAL8_9LAMI|nr:hypothetical protein Salat_1383300 [Sesamum alatum]